MKEAYEGAQTEMDATDRAIQSLGMNKWSNTIALPDVHVSSGSSENRTAKPCEHNVTYSKGGAGPRECSDCGERVDD